MVNTVISYDSARWHQVFVEITSLRVVPFSVVEQFVANINFEINVAEVSHMSVGSEMISDKDFGLFGSGSVGAACEEKYIS